MEESLKALLGYCSIGLLVFSIVVSHLLPNHWIWTAVVGTFLAGFLVGIYQSGLPGGLLLGLILGIVFNILILSSGLLSKFYQTRATERLRKRYFKEKD